MVVGTAPSTTEGIAHFGVASVESIDGVLQHFSTDPANGLTEQAARERLQRFGPNRMTGRKSNGAWIIFLRQFQSTVVGLLIVAGVISFVMHEPIQAAGILAAVIINAVVGFLTELRAKMSLDKLEALAGPTARIVRDGREKEIAAHDLVPGDIIILDAGARVPADVRLIEASSLSVDESSLSGESVPVYKAAMLADVDPDQNQVLSFQGTMIVSGRARGVVIATGDNTKLGNLGRLLSETVSSRTPLEEQLEELGKQLTILIVVLCVVLAIVGILHDENMWLMIQTSIALAVAAIPEGMPVVATLALAVGTQRMVRAQALVRQLSAVETLGCTTVICTDKTGTLTENQMMVTDVAFNGRHLNLSGSGYEPVGEVTEAGHAVCAIDDRILVDLLRATALCNDAKLENHGGEVAWHVHGDPTEGALIAAAGKAGLVQTALMAEYPRVAEIPFDLQRKRMSTIHSTADGDCTVFVKGSPESIIGCCTRIHAPDRDRTFCDSDKEWLGAMNELLAANGLRVLAAAFKRVDAVPTCVTVEEIESDLTLLGLVGMSDQPRAEVESALASCKKAGIKVIMVTGDQPTTARAIARQLHLGNASEDDRCVITGAQLAAMNEAEMRLMLESADVLARVTPEMKLAVVGSLQRNGEIVAMTGDGVNDAPALRQANIGVAMGRGGTALAREASSMVITDDNFATIVKAIREGRIIYGNIRKAIAYLLTASVASVICIALSVLFDTGLPMTPLQLLWLNLIMHVFPGLGIVLQRSNTDIMSQPPRAANERLVNFDIGLQILVRSFIVGLAVIAALQVGHVLEGTADKTTTIGFATLSVALLLQALSWANFELRPIDLRTTRIGSAMVINIGISLMLLIVAIYVPALQVVLDTRALNYLEFLFVAAVALCSLLGTHIVLALIGRNGKERQPG